MKRILSIQGGGIRGILPACMLTALERQTGRLTREVFDFIGGTSTGAVLTAAIAAGVPAADSLNVYLNRGRRIFTPTDGFRRNVNLITHGRQFDSKVLARVLEDAMGPVASKWSINQSPVDLLITAADQLGDTMYFTKDRGSNAGHFGKYSLLAAAVASGCATTYHDPWLVPGLGYCADGGCAGVADPVYETCVEALTGNGCYGTINPEEACVISLCTGYYKPGAMPNPPGSLLARVKWVTGALVGSSKTIAATTVQRHWPGILQVLNASIPTDIDEADVNNIQTLLELSQNAASKLDWYKILGL